MLKKTKALLIAAAFICIGSVVGHSKANASMPPQQSTDLIACNDLLYIETGGPGPDGSIDFLYIYEDGEIDYEITDWSPEPILYKQTCNNI